MPSENIADGLIAHLVTDVRECAGDSIVSPRSILFRNAHDQLLDFFVDARSAWILTFCGSVEFLRDQPPMPTEYRLWLDDIGDFLEYLSPKFLADLRQRLPLAIGEFDAALDLAPQDSVLGHEVLVLRSSSSSTEPVM